MPTPALPDRTLARLTGALFLLMAVGGITGMVARAGVVVPTDAAATAQNLLTQSGLYRTGLFGDLAAFLIDVPVAILLFFLLRPAGLLLATTATAFRLVYAAVVGANLLHHVGAALFLERAEQLSAFSTEQVQQLALHETALHQHGYSLALLFFAAHLLLLGVLLWRSTAFPRWLGALMGVAGVAYVLDGVALLVAPDVQAALNPFLALPMSGELVLAVWMLVKGVHKPTAAV